MIPFTPAWHRARAEKAARRQDENVDYLIEAIRTHHGAWEWGRRWVRDLPLTDEQKKRIANAEARMREIAREEYLMATDRENRRREVARDVMRERITTMRQSMPDASIDAITDEILRRLRVIDVMKNGDWFGIDNRLAQYDTLVKQLEEKS